MRYRWLGVLLAVSISVWAAGTGSAAAAGPCDRIVQESDRVTQAQLAFTIQAYSDGEITPEEAAQAEVYSRRITQITLDLGECLRTGVVPPGYPPLNPRPDEKPPVTNTFNVELAKWRIGDRGLKISWDTSEPTSVRIDFARKVKGVRGSNGSCQQAARNASGKPCQLFIIVGTIKRAIRARSATFNGTAGTSKRSIRASVIFKGKAGKHRLKPGSYLVKMVATDAAGNKSKPKTDHLKILPRLRRGHR